MKLVDLEPEWLTPDLFIFRNPTGGTAWLTCKRVAMTHWEQYELFYGKDGVGGTKFTGQAVVPTKDEMAWQFEGNDFTTMTVTPSLDASASGNWHGFITNGEVQ